MTDKPPFDPSAPFSTAPPGGDKPAFDPSSPFTTAPPSAPDDGPMSWSDVPGKALENAIPSAGRLAGNIAQPFMHPIETAKNIGDIGHGLAQSLGVSPDADNPEDLAKWQAVAGQFKDRYGSVENLKKTIATDPVGFAADLSIPLTGGESMLARAPGMIGRAGDIAGTVGRAIDPVTNVGRAVGLAGRGAAHTLGVTSGAGAEALKTAYGAGQEGGEAARAFRENMTGAAPMQDAVDDARTALGNLRKERGQAYRDAMQGISADKTIMSWNDVDIALDDMDKVATYKGQSLSPSTEAVRSSINAAVDNWKNLRASEFWTPEGFDALKKQIGDIRDSTEFGTPSRVVADQAYQAVRKTIIDQAPAYAEIMKGYEQASTQLREIEKTLSLNPNATVDTSLRKLQSTLRDNVNTSFGRRAELANFLVNAGAPHLMEKLAGQALKSWTPRGLSRAVAAATVEGIPSAIGTAMGATHGIGAGITGAATGAAAAIPGLATMSPRLMGEASYGLGKLSRMRKAALPTIKAARQIGRASNGDQQ